MAQIENLPLILTGLSITASIVYYASVLRNANKTQQMQLETRQVQMFMNIYDKLETRENTAMLLPVLMNEFESVEEFHQKYGVETNPSAYSDWLYFANILEGIGVLVRQGYVDVELVARLMSGMVIRYWEKYLPVFMDFRESWNWPRSAAELEYLYDAIIEYGEKHPELQIG